MAIAEVYVTFKDKKQAVESQKEYVKFNLIKAIGYIERKFRKNKNTTKITSTTAINKLIPTSCNEARIVVERSIASDKFTALGIDACNCGNNALTASTVAIIFAPDCLLRTNTTAFLPLR